MITRDNIDELLDKGQIECAMTNGRWWAIRRNGATKHWKKDPKRIRIPFKMGMYGYGAIDESDFDSITGELNRTFYRLTQEEPKSGA